MAKILLVEDDNNLREIYEARLQAEGYNIVSAHDGEEALVVAKNETPDLIISDVMMPKISGFEMLDILRNTDGLKDVKVIMLTALGQSDDQQRADRLGANRYLVKSQVTLEDIVKVAQDLLASEEAAPASVTTTVAPPAPVATQPVAAPTPAATATALAATPAVAPAALPEPVVVVTPPTPDPVPVVDPPVVPVTVAVDPPVVPVTVAVDPPVVPVTVAPVAPEPVVTPAAPVLTVPEPTEEPAVIPVAAPPAPEGAQPIDEEAASVESQIEDFVAGASAQSSPPQTQGEAPEETIVFASATPATAAPTPESIALPAPVSPPVDQLTFIPVPTPPVAPEPVEATYSTAGPANDSSKAAVAAGDTELITNAVNTLIANTQTTPPAPVSTESPTLTVPSRTPASQPGAVSQAGGTSGAPEVRDAQDLTPAGSQNHKKVISPISDMNAISPPDLSSLLAAEDAKETAGTQSTPSIPTPAPAAPVAAPEPPAAPPAISPVQSGAAPTPPEPEAFDPNSIAL